MFTFYGGEGKTEDPANFDIFKQNGFMLGTNTSAFEGGKSGQWNNQTVLKNDMHLFFSLFFFPSSFFRTRQS